MATTPFRRHDRRRLLAVAFGALTALVLQTVFAVAAVAAAEPTGDNPGDVYRLDGTEVTVDGTVAFVFSDDDFSDVAREFAGDAVDVETVTRVGDGRIRFEVPANEASDATASLARLDVAGEVDKPVYVADTGEQPGAGATAVVSDPLWASQWGPAKARFAQAWPASRGTNIRVAVIDTGVNNIGDLAGRLESGVDFVDGGAAADGHGHGTSAASVIAAANDARGIVGGCPECRIVPVRVLDNAGQGFMSDVAAGVDWARLAGVDVINMSLAGPSTTPSLDAALARAAAAHVTVVAAAGNSGSVAVTYPAGHRDVIAVSATNEHDSGYGWTNRGAWTDVGAPGCNLAATRTGSGWGWFCGTSSAAPLVSAAAALAAANAEPPAIRAALRATGPGTDIGVRRLDVPAFLAAAATTPEPEPEPPATLPAPKITSPAAGTWVDTSTLVQVATTRVGTVTFLVDGVVVGTDTTQPYSKVVDTSALAAGPHTIGVRHADGPVAAVRVSVDHTAPKVATTVTTAPRALVVASSASDPSGITAVHFFVDSHWVGTDRTIPYRVSVPVMAGTRLVQVGAVDATGQVAWTSDVVAVPDVEPDTGWEDTTVPDGRITWPRSGSVVGARSVVAVSVADDTALAAVQLWDGWRHVETRTVPAVTGPVTTTFRYTATTPGRKQLRIRIIDKAGNATWTSPSIVVVR